MKRRTVVHIKRNDEIDITFCGRMAADLDVFDDEEGATCGACFSAYLTHCDALDARTGLRADPAHLY